jgi:hypothetical protein
MPVRSAADLQLWVVRGTLRGQDVSIVLEASSRQEAEYLGWKRGVPVVIVAEATEYDIRAAKEAGTLFRFTPHRGTRAFGRPVTNTQKAIFMLCGIAIALLNLRLAELPIPLPRLF